jgi:hypothetical protein
MQDGQVNEALSFQQHLLKIPNRSNKNTELAILIADR